MINNQLVREFLKYEVDDYVRAQLLSAAAALRTGSQYFTYNTFNVRLDADSASATIEDELDVSREVTLGLEEFLALVAERHESPS